jgi:hypothetical protein
MRENEVALRSAHRLAVEQRRARVLGPVNLGRRLVVIPFNAAYAPSPGERAAIKAEGPAILAKMINAAD